MVMNDNASFGSGAVESSPPNRRQRTVKLEVYNEILQRLKSLNYLEVRLPGFDDELFAHFNHLPTRYALDVNVERPEDVLKHKRLLHLARDPANRPAIDVRLLQVSPLSCENSADSAYLGSQQNIHPAFGSSSNLEALAQDTDRIQIQHEETSISSCADVLRPTHEIMFSTCDKPKLLSKLTSLLAEVGLNIQEAHAFSTTDGYSLDVFVVNGWPYEETELLQTALEKEASKIEKPSWPPQDSFSSVVKHEELSIACRADYLEIPTDGTDVWEINPQLLNLEKKVASGSYGDLYKGTYCSQEVAVKLLKAEHVTEEIQREFVQEVFIMRKVRHKNVVQFMGACTKGPCLCIVTEYMSGGSVYDYIHKQSGTFKLPVLLKFAIDICKGMNYLHQQNIIHRDLKAANLLLDENDVVKVADFGVARVKAQSGVMTAETGTYRWMAPEVIEHHPYDHKADIFSFGVVIWELLTGKLPYDHLTPVQAAVGVVQKGLRPEIPNETHPKIVQLLERCWQKDPASRPDFSEITLIIQQIAKEVGAGDERLKEETKQRPKDKASGGFLSVFRRDHH